MKKYEDKGMFFIFPFAIVAIILLIVGLTRLGKSKKFIKVAEKCRLGDSVKDVKRTMIDYKLADSGTNRLGVFYLEYVFKNFADYEKYVFYFQNDQLVDVQHAYRRTR